jgi:hypothetical protein
MYRKLQSWHFARQFKRVQTPQLHSKEAVYESINGAHFETLIGIAIPSF